MEKILKILNKRYDKKFYSYPEHKQKEKMMKTCFEEYKLDFISETPLDYFLNEIIYQGIQNKEAIEKAYFLGKQAMEDYYDTLDYLEKQRLMNFEIKMALEQLTPVMDAQQAIYIPFFTASMNAIYTNDMARFDIPSYRNYVRNFIKIYNDPIALYGYHFFIPEYTSGILVYEGEDTIALFNKVNKTLYFIQNDAYENHLIMIQDVDIDTLKAIAKAYFEGNPTTFVETLRGLEFIHAKDIKKIDTLVRKAYI